MTAKTAALGFSRNGAANYIAALCSRGVLRDPAGAEKTHVFTYEEYPDILRKDT